MADRSAVAVDISRLLTGLRFARPSGIERMELGYATRLGDGGDGVVLTPAGPRALRNTARRKVAAAAEARWREGRKAPGADEVAAEIADVITFVETGRRAPPRPARRSRLPLGLIPHLLRAATRTPAAALPRDAVYLHTSFFRLERPAYFKWLERRGDVSAVFVLYDLLPLQHPDFFRAGEAALHAGRIATAARHGRLIIVPAATIADELKAYLRHAGLPEPPIAVMQLPVEDIFTPAPVEGAPDRPFFLCCGTIEPRKNHKVLLDAWRLLAADEGDAAPRLVTAGRRGWRNEDVFAALDAPGVLSPLVLEAPDLSTAALAGLMRRARGVLSPSFAEGYGLPVAEALASGTPVLAADIAIYRELWGQQAHLLPAHDAPAWADAIAALSGLNGPGRPQLNAQPAHAMRWSQHIDGIEGLLAGT